MLQLAMSCPLWIGEVLPTVQLLLKLGARPTYANICWAVVYVHEPERMDVLKALLAAGAPELPTLGTRDAPVDIRGHNACPFDKLLHFEWATGLPIAELLLGHGLRPLTYRWAIHEEWNEEQHAWVSQQSQDYCPAADCAAHTCHTGIRRCACAQALASRHKSAGFAHWPLKSAERSGS